MCHRVDRVLRQSAVAGAHRIGHHPGIEQSCHPLNGLAQIVATVIEESGTPAHNGTLVTFTTTLGTLDPREAVTNNGQAVVTLRAGTESGAAEVGAFSGSARTEAPVMIAIGGAAAVNLSVGPSPGTVDQVVTFTATATGTTLPIASYA